MDKVRGRFVGTFSEKVRHGEVVGPRKRTFTLDGWKAAYEGFSSNDQADKALYVSGKHICAKLEAIRKATVRSSLTRLSTETQIKALVSAANHQFEAFEVQAKRHIVRAQEGGTLEIRDLAATRVTLADGVSYNVDAALSGMLDGIAIPIKVALSEKSKNADNGFDDVVWNDVRRVVNLGALYDQVENLWEDCVWNTYFLVDAQKPRSTLIAAPRDITAKRGTRAAAARRIALGFESTSYAIQAFKRGQANDLILRIKEVRAVVTEGEKQRIVLGPGGLDPISTARLFALRTMASPPYYDSLIDERLPLLAGATLSQLFDGWMVVSHAAQILWRATSPAHQPQPPAAPGAVSNMAEYVPFFTFEALVAAVHEATGTPVAMAQAIIEFLTFRGKNAQEFWTQPLVPTGDSSELYPVFGAVATPPNLRYVLECWMVQLDIKLDQRGLAFESYLRHAVVEAVKESPLLSKIAKVVPRDYTFRCSDGSFGQVDMLFCIGSRVFVVEAKCILEPTVSTSIGTHRSAIEHAAIQARTRVKLIEEHREEFIAQVQQFGWHLPMTFRVYPLVAVNSIAHVGIPFDGVSVVDELVLGKFFQGGYDSVALGGSDLSVVQSIHRSFYATEAEAEACAALYFEQPPQLEQYSSDLRLRQIPIYAVSESDWGGLVVDFDHG